MSTPTIARVVLDTPLPQLDRLLDYRIPEGMEGVVPGVRVTVPLRSANRMTQGFVVELTDQQEHPGPLSDLDTIVRSNRQERWQPIVVATSSRDREQTYIYSRPDKDQLQLLIVARDREDTTVVQLRIEPKMFLETVQHPGRARGQFSF